MRKLLLIFLLSVPAGINPTMSQADSHTCDQLRLSVSNRVPGISRDLPYDQLDCAGISELHLLLTRQRGTSFAINQRIEAIFRRYGLIN